ncbi:MAG: ATP-binding cassette domain-containing protein [Bacteroidetes bacterium]|nr:MAG: ATP-binding cassette domain-containing protein [Bacteroidota bacterium]
MDYIFRAEEVSKKYDKHQALTNVSIEVPQSGIFGLLGPNGAGKTTLIRIINQIIAPDTGNLFFNGQKLNPEHIKEIGYLPEERGLYKKMKVGEQAMYLARLKDVKHKEAKVLLRYWFEKFDLMPWWDRKVEELSKGMQQKVQFIVTVLHRPRLLIFDEPFSGFDPININLLKDEIMNLKNQGTSIIFSTHNMSSVEELCDHIVLINKSEKILGGKLEDIRKSHSSQIFSLTISGQKSESDRLFEPVAELLEEKPQRDGVKVIRVKIREGSSANDLIRHILPQADLHSFHEELPTMNDVFIKTVTGKYPHERKSQSDQQGVKNKVSEIN